MAFRATDFNIIDWINLDNAKLLVKVARTFNSVNLVANEYKTLTTTKEGGPSLYIEYIYDANGNIISETPEIREWTPSQETVTETESDPSPVALSNSLVDTEGNEALVTVDGRLKVTTDLEDVTVIADNLNIEDVTVKDVGTVDDSLKVKHTGTITSNATIQNSSLAVTKSGTWNVDSITSDVNTKSQTQYSALTSDVQYWLGLEEDGQLTKIYNGVATSIKQIFNFALSSTIVGGPCLERIHFISSSVITGKQDIVGVWTQAMQDTVAPDISDITLSAATVVEDQVVDYLIGTLATSGAYGGHGDIAWTLTSTTLSGNKLRIDSNKLEVGPNVIGSSDAGTYNAVIKATDQLGGAKEKIFVITVSSNDLTNIALSGDSINYGDPIGTDIGTLSIPSDAGGVGSVSFSITDYGGMSNIRIVGDILEAGPSWMSTTAANNYPVKITATDQAPTPQTFEKQFDIDVVDTSVQTVTFDNDTTAASVNYGDATGVDIGTLKSTGGFGDTTFSITDYGTLNKSPASQNIRIVTVGDDQILEVGPASYMDTGPPALSGTAHTIKITATDSAPSPQSKEQAFQITVASTAITNIELSATEVVDDAEAGIDIGDLTVVGGIGDVAITISNDGGLDNVKTTDTGTSTALFEVDTGGIVDSAGSYSVTFLGTDTINQTFSKAIDISVNLSFTNNRFLNFDAEGANEYLSIGKKAEFNDTDDFFFRRRSDNWTISWWMRLPESSADYSADSGQYDRVIFKSQSAWFTNGPQLYFRAKQFRFWYGKSTTEGGLWELEDVVDWQDNVWHHYALTWDATAALARYISDSNTSPNLESYLKLYKDGSQVTIWSEKNSTSSGDNGYNNHGGWFASDYDSNNTDKDFRFGYPDPNSYPTDSFNKTMGINDVAIWKSTLTHGQINSLHDSEASKYKNTKYFKMTGGIGAYSNHSSNNGRLSQYQNDPTTNWDIDAHKMLTTTGSEGFAFSWWMKFNPAYANCNPLTGTGLWVSTAGSGSQKAVVSYDKHYNQFYIIHVNQSGQLEVALEGPNNNFCQIPLFDFNDVTAAGVYGSDTAEDNVWRHYVVTYVGGWTTESTQSDSFQLYVNGQSGGTKPGSQTGTITSHEPIGQSSSDGLYKLGGALDTDSYSLWNIKFTAADALEMYNLGKGLPAKHHSKFSITNCYGAHDAQNALDAIGDVTQNTTAFGTGEQVMDQSGNGNHLSCSDMWGMQPEILDHPITGVDSGMYEDITQLAPATAEEVAATNLKRYYKFESENKYLRTPTDNVGWGYLTSNYLGPWGGMGAGDSGVTPAGMPDTLEDWAANVWVRLPDVYATSRNHYFIMHNGSSPNQGYNRLYLKIATSGSVGQLKLTYYYRTAGGAREFKTGNTVVGPGWHMFTWSKPTTIVDAAHTADDIDIYLDGTPLTISTVPSGSWVAAEGHVSVTNADRPRLLYAGSTEEIYFKDASFFNTALSPETVTSMYNSGDPTDLTGATGLVGYYRFGDGDNGSGTPDAYNLIHDMSGSNTQHFDVISTNYTGSDNGKLVLDSGKDSANKYDGVIGSQVVSLPYYDNTKYINSGSWLRNAFYIKNAVGDVSSGDVLIRADKPWTINMWIKAGATAGGSAGSQSWSDGGRPIWSCGSDDWVNIATAGTKGYGLSLNVYGDELILRDATDGGLGLAVYAGTLTDTLWYMVTVTNVPVDNLGDTWHWDIGENEAYTEGITVYLNGVRAARNAYHTDSDDDMCTPADHKFRIGAGETEIYTKNFLWDNFTMHNTTKTASEVLAMYNEGTATGFDSDTSAKVWIKAEDLPLGTSGLEDGDVIANKDGTYEVTCETIGSPSGSYVAGTVTEY